MVKKRVGYRRQKLPDSEPGLKVYFEWFHLTQSGITLILKIFFNINYIFLKPSNLYKNLV